MKSLWNDIEAARYPTEIGLRIYTSRLLGRDPTLVLHGGGNTSVKARALDAVGEAQDILYVKGSGWDLETIEEAGFAPARMAHLLKLARLEALSDTQMMNELATQVTRAGAPAPSVEAILHAILPYKYVDHTHADALLAITNTPGGEKRAREIYGKDTVIVPYVMPGFDLARQCARQFATEARADTIGMVLMNHGIFSFGNTAKEAYERMIALVTRAEDYLNQNNAWALPQPKTGDNRKVLRHELARLRQDISACAGIPLVFATHSNAKFLDFSRRSDVAALSQQGPATPDHVIRTKRVPMLGRDVRAYAAAYKDYFDRHAPSAREAKTMLDPAPRVVLDPEFGLGCVGRSAKDARMVHDIYAHTIDVILRAAALGGYLGFFYAMFQHLNIRTPRWLGYLIQRPEAHSVHHGRGIHAYNYGNFPLQDLLLGTFRNPKGFTPEAGFWDGASAQVGAMLLGRDVGQRPVAGLRQSAEAPFTLASPR